MTASVRLLLGPSGSGNTAKLRERAQEVTGHVWWIVPTARHAAELTGLPEHVRVHTFFQAAGRCARLPENARLLDDTQRKTMGLLVGDIVGGGAEPLLMPDYVATGKVVRERIAAIVSGIAAACAQAGVALIGGETAEHPGLLEPDEYDVAGAATGVVEYADIIGPHRVQPGDVVLALASSGLHSNGYSLVRRVIAAAGWSLDRHVDDFGHTVGEELLTPTRVYAADLLALIRTPGIDIHGLSHVTGGGLAANLARVLPHGVFARVDRSTWTPPAVFRTIGELGRVPALDLERTLNMGVGFVAVLPAHQSDAAIEVCRAHGIPAWVLGEITGAENAPVDPAYEVVRGAKGVDGGSVQVVGEFAS